MRSTNIGFLSLPSRIMARINQRKYVKRILGIALIAIVGAFAVPIRESYAAGLDLVFAYTISDDTVSAVDTGLTSGLSYEGSPGQGWSALTSAGLKIVSGRGTQVSCGYQRFLGDSIGCSSGTTSYDQTMSNWNAYLQSPLVQNNLNNIVGFALSDDWYNYPGAGKTLFQDMTTAVHKYAPGHRSICIFSANTSYAHTPQGYIDKFAGAKNFSPSGCDMVGFYLYPTVNKQPLTNFTNAIAGLKLLGLNPSVTPIIGIAESYNTTGTAVENEVKYMCDNGATSIGFWAYNTGMGTAAAVSADIRGGMSRGIQYCGGASSTPGTGSTGGTTTTTTTDSTGNTTATTTDTSGKITSTTTDSSGQVVSTGTGTTTTDNAGNNITTTTDSSGNTTTTTTTNSGSVASVTTDSTGAVTATSTGAVTATSTGTALTGTTGTNSSYGESVLGDSGWTGSIDNNIVNDILAFFDPDHAILPANSSAATTSALPPAEQALQDLFAALSQSATTATSTCSSEKSSVGFIPCGKNTDDPDTAWNECDACDLCAMVLMGQLSITFLIKVAATAATLAILFAGYVYIFAVGKADLIGKAKKMMMYALIGFLIIFLAWAIVDSLLTTLGYIDPMGDSWYTIC